MDSAPKIPQSLRYKCSACYKQYNKKEHLVEHMKASFHSVHQPRCGVCKKYCKTLESVREHLKGPLAKANCAEAFSVLGCDFCLTVFDCADALRVHKLSCHWDPPAIPEVMALPSVDMHSEAEIDIWTSSMADDNNTSPKLVAMDCEMVGGGSDGSLDLCARVCLINENEEVIFHSYVKPLIPVTNYRYEITGIREDHLAYAKPLSDVRKRVEEILRNGEESTWRMRSWGGKACILIGHDLEHDLNCLQMDYPDNLRRDTAKYFPLFKTNLICHSLKYLTQTYLGYEIQSEVHNPYEDSVAAMRIYKKLRSQAHQTEGMPAKNDGDYYSYNKKMTPYDRYTINELLKKSPDELFEISRPAYKCWCSDATRSTHS